MQSKPSSGRKIKVAEEKRRILMVGHILRYHPAIVKLQKLIQDGTLGKINYLYSNRLNIGKIRTEENILWSFAPHDISVMLSLLNEMPTRVACRGTAYLNRDVADVTRSEEHTSELQSLTNLVCRLLLEKKNKREYE